MVFELEIKKSENIPKLYDVLFSSLKWKVEEDLASQMAVEFTALRNSAINSKLPKIALLDNLKSYHDQLILLGGKIKFTPEACHVKFKWFCSYTARGEDKSDRELCDIEWEFANVLFNIAILHYLQGKRKSKDNDRSEALKFFREAAGIVEYLKDHQTKGMNRRTNDLQEHALELIFNAFIGFAQIEVAKKAAEDGKKNELVARLYEGAKRQFNDSGIMTSAKALKQYLSSHYKYCEAMVNYHMALHEEDDPQWLREAELRLTVARDNLGTLLKNYPEFHDENEKVELAYKRVNSARAATGEPPEFEKNNLVQVKPELIAKAIDYNKRCFSQNSDGIFDVDSTRDRPDPIQENTSCWKSLCCCFSRVDDEPKNFETQAAQI